MNANEYLVDEVRARVERLDRETCLEWGGEWVDGEARVTNPAGEQYRQRTVVRSIDDALEAFAKYTEYAEHVLETFTPTHSEAVLLPCGSSKPIGSSSIHSRKLAAIEAAGLADRCDVLILSEPCTIVPHNERLTLAAANYDFPPEFTAKATAPDVHAEFAKRVARFVEHAEYDRIYAYLPKGHRAVFESAIELVDDRTQVVHIPGASFNPESGAYCGDLMQSTETIAAKLFYAARFSEVAL